jgi:hypothetical protein
MNNILKEFDEIGFGNQAKIIGTKRVELRSWIDKKINQAKQEERERIKENIERINIFPIAAIDGMVLEFISKGKVLKLLTKSNKDE